LPVNIPRHTVRTQVATAAVIAAMVVVGLALGLDLLYLVRGSLEEFPTPEQQDKVRTVTGALAVLLALAELALWLLVRRLRRA
jgi:hypothetical protein